MLKGYNWNVDIERTAAKAKYKLSFNNYDLVVMDAELPDEDGIDFCADLRAKEYVVPIIIVSYLDSTNDKVEGLNAGADDYIIKPFRAEELMARIRAVIRRYNQEKPNPLIRINNVEINTNTQEVFLNGEQIHLTPLEYRVLHYMAQNRDRIVSREELLEHVWGEDPATILSNTVNVHIHSLRKKLVAESFLFTWRSGYRLQGAC
jgi:DNA-binding response OmpR family regulator